MVGYCTSTPSYCDPRLGNGTVALSTKHVLAVTNRGGASTADVMALASHIRDGVQAEFGITLVPECDLVGCSLT